MEILKVQLSKFRFTNSGLLQWGIPALVLVVVAILLKYIPHDTHLTLADTRPVVVWGALLLGIAALCLAIWMFMAGWRLRGWFPLWMALRSVGWLGSAASALGIMLFLISALGTPSVEGVMQAVQSVVPLVVGMQAAFLFSPDDEAGLDVLLACPRGIWWLLLERIGVLFALQGAIAIIGTFVTLRLAGEQDILLAISTWFAPAVFLAGVGAYTTVRSRQPAFGIAVVCIVWGGLGFFGSALLPGTKTFWPLTLIQPFLWSIHGFLPVGLLPSADYWTNRVIVTAVGILLIAWTVRWLSQEERLLLGAEARKQR